MLKLFTQKCRSPNAFTLAEVLITLGIIGVVAALTMPTLIMNHKKSVIETRLKKFYSSVNQAINLSELENGEKQYWRSNILSSKLCNNSNYETEECITYFFETYLKQFIKYTEYEFIVNKGFLLYFNDGSCVRIKHPWDYYFYPVASDVKKANAIRGKDFFPFRMDQNFSRDCFKNEFKNKGIEPFIDDNWDCTERGLYVSPYSSTKLIQINGWKIPNDYPWLK